MIKSHQKWIYCSYIPWYVGLPWGNHDRNEKFFFYPVYSWCRIIQRVCLNTQFLQWTRILRLHNIDNWKHRDYWRSSTCNFRLWSVILLLASSASWIWGNVERWLPACQSHFMMLHNFLWSGAQNLLPIFLTTGFHIVITWQIVWSKGKKILHYCIH